MTRPHPGRHSFGGCALVIHVFAIRDPFPGISNHIVETEWIRRERTYGRSVLPTIRALSPASRAMLTISLCTIIGAPAIELVPPPNPRVVDPGARGIFPFRLAK